MNILDKIKKDGLMMDGAMGSILIRQGLKGNEAAESWNITHPDIIKQVHTDYFNAGADVATANTYGASPLKLEKMGVTKDAETLNRAGVRLAREACGQGHYVAADMGAMGDMLSPSGPVSFDQALESFTAQARVIASEGVDLFLLETIFDLNVALCAIKAIQSVSDTPIFCSLTFKETPRGFFTLFGNNPEESMNALVDEGASVVGANCTIGSETMIRLAGQIRQSVDVPVIIQPNAGIPQSTADGQAFYPETNEQFSGNMKKIRDLGVEVIGGCCGTTPETIRAMKKWMPPLRA